MHRTSGVHAVASSSISGSGFSAAEDATSPMSPAENYLYKLNGRRCEYAVEQFVDTTEFRFDDVHSGTRSDWQLC